MTNPIKDLHPKSIDQDVQIILDEFSNLVEEVVNFGTHVMKWDLNEATGKDENIPVIMMLRNIIELLDSVSILIKQSSIDPCKVILRSVLETTVQLEYLIETDTVKRGHCFLYWHYHNELKIAKKLTPTDPTNIDLARKYQADKSLPAGSLPPIIDQLDEHTRNLQAILSSTVLNDAHMEYQNILSRGEKVKNWYQLCGNIKSFEQLVNSLNRQSLYEVIYRSWSGPTHGTDILTGKLSASEEGNAQIVQIRYVKDAQIITNFAATFGIMIYQLLSKQRIIKHKQEVEMWYMSIREIYNRTSGKPLITVT